jgi:Na+/glutamate symporter
MSDSDNKNLVNLEERDAPELLKQLLEVRQSEQLIQQQQQAIRQQEIQNAHDYALKLLEANKEDRKDTREHTQKAVRSFSIVLIIVVIILAMGACYALYLNKDPIVIQTIKTVGLLAGGFLGGYSAKSLKKKNSDTENE